MANFDDTKVIAYGKVNGENPPAWVVHKKCLDAFQKRQGRDPLGWNAVYFHGAAQAQLKGVKCSQCGKQVA